MPSERRVEPSRARLERAWRGGHRPGSPWLVHGLAWLGLASTLTLPPTSRFAPWSARMQQALAAATIDTALLRDTFAAALTWAAPWLAATLVAMLLAMLLSGTLGPVDRTALQTLSIAPLRPPWAFPIVGGTLVLLALALLLAPVLAGAARAPDASSAALTLLWWTWLQRLAATIGAVLVAAGIAELLVAHARWIRALRQTVEEVRRERNRERPRRQASR